ncbi:bZIP transcription factor [Aspergillus clavatus NRRL 1]|uniref:BZIP transcription factor, putative n=1 Tax=Aspergillus clavatus (strain ATCC 1007 / CBS 513.65 / DSM 816 / NCTC 3887 / NRRL 1 / QM 1276 / 107) TaxID=344612 RepID=A1CNX2_ASPCL|nr:bZIP transcription factor, putative [Aspergillus clavatus NRRL 1]EAW07343.1 bZIP transcription factor, putative [Aspergillus clavatus NRRL 1]
MSSTPDNAQSKKRESRAGTRKVTTLSAEQLARKRANDREAQRTIRQRTKEHIERLQSQVAELQAKNQQYDDVLRRNAVLEQEIKGLRQQLTILTGEQGYSNVAEGPYNSPSGAQSSAHYSDSLNVPPVSRAPSVLSASSQVSVAPEWQAYGSTRSSSICESSEADYTNRTAEPYRFEGQIQQPANTLSGPMPHVNFNPPSAAHPPAPPFQTYPQYFRASGPEGTHGEHLLRNPQPATPYVPGQPSLPMPEVSSERGTGYPVLQNSQHYHHPPNQPGNNQGYGYGWPPQS